MWRKLPFFDEARRKRRRIGGGGGLGCGWIGVVVVCNSQMNGARKRDSDNEISVAIYKYVAYGHCCGGRSKRKSVADLFLRIIWKWWINRDTRYSLEDGQVTSWSVTLIAEHKQRRVSAAEQDAEEEEIYCWRNSVATGCSCLLADWLDRRRRSVPQWLPVLGQPTLHVIWLTRWQGR